MGSLIPYGDIELEVDMLEELEQLMQELNQEDEVEEAA